ncbi:MAG: hypothetical protein LW875_08070 [Proteobacteria bacterium]|jgi:DNA-binding NtrC family response regulator|nr:hypothetical protein [Pseudomonadota bacterium]
MHSTTNRDEPDIEPLVAQFTNEICRENGFQKVFNRRCLETLANQKWRGNVRELRSFVERNLLVSDTREIGPEHLADLMNQNQMTYAPKTLEEFDRQVEDMK